MTQVSIQLDGVTVRSVPITVQLIAPPSTNTAHGPDGEIVSTYKKQRTDQTGYLLLDLTPTEDLEPAGCFYRITAHTTPAAKWNIYLSDANAPPTGGPYEVGLSQLQVATPTPPDWVPVATVVDPDLLTPILDQYFIDHPLDVSGAVETALEASPPLLVSNNLSEITSDATARANIGAASTQVVTDLATQTSRIDALVLTESTDPAVRSSMVSEASGVITIVTS